MMVLQEQNFYICICNVWVDKNLHLLYLPICLEGRMLGKAKKILIMINILSGDYFFVGLYTGRYV